MYKQTTKFWIRNLSFVGIAHVFYLLNSALAFAQILPDTTLPEPSTVTKQGNINFIEGGTTQGGNLFHSFEQFSLPTGSEAYFNNTTDIQNIFSRVTGSSVSNIDGLLKANGTANLFILNSNGIIFGSNASLNIGGSFLASTASNLNFADGTQFNTNSSQTKPLLTVSAPIGLVFESNSGAIRVEGTGHNLIDRPFTPITGYSNVSGLQVQPGKTLALLGGDINIQGGILTAPEATIELSSVGDGLVNIIPSTSGWMFGYQNLSSFQDIKLLNKALIVSIGGGSVGVNGRQISLHDGSVLLVGTEDLRLSASISVNASDSLEISGSSPNGNIVTSLLAGTSNVGNGGNITVTTKRLNLKDGGRISSASFGEGKSGNLILNAFDSVQLFGVSVANPSQTSSIGNVSYNSGNAGSIIVNTRQFTIKDGANVASTTFSSGMGGDVTVNAADFIKMSESRTNNFSPSSLSSTTFGFGQAGTLTVNTSRLVLTNSSSITTSSLAFGKAGNLNINASESIELNGSTLIDRFPSSSNITSSTIAVGEDLQGVYKLPLIPTGASGNIAINTPSLKLTDGAFIAVSNFGSGNAGTLRLNIGSIFLDEASIAAASASGEGGNIFLRSHELQLQQGSSIRATADNRGNGGNINIDTDLLTVLERSNITADAFQGRGGNIQINTQGFFRSPDSSITASSQLGVNGTVRINTLLTNPNNGLVELPSVPINILGLVAQGCRDGSGAKGASFVITGRGGLPRHPGEPLRVDAVRVAGATEAQTENRLVAINSQTTRPESSAGLVEANSWIVNSKGDVILLAQPSQPSIAKSSDSTLTCYAP